MAQNHNQDCLASVMTSDTPICKSSLVTIVAKPNFVYQIKPWRTKHDSDERNLSFAVIIWLDLATWHPHHNHFFVCVAILSLPSDIKAPDNQHHRKMQIVLIHSSQSIAHAQRIKTKKDWTRLMHTGQTQCGDMTPHAWGTQQSFKVQDTQDTGNNETTSAIMPHLIMFHDWTIHNSRMCNQPTKEINFAFWSGTHQLTHSCLTRHSTSKFAFRSTNSMLNTRLVTKDVQCLRACWKLYGKI